jgi:hypothetical protein
MTLDESRAFAHLVRRFGSQLEMTQAIGCSAPAATHWSQKRFPMARRLELLKVALDRGLDVNPSIVVGRDMLALICKIAGASQKAGRRGRHAA